MKVVVAVASNAPDSVCCASQMEAGAAVVDLHAEPCRAAAARFARATQRDPAFWRGTLSDAGVLMHLGAQLILPRPVPNPFATLYQSARHVDMPQHQRLAYADLSLHSIGNASSRHTQRNRRRLYLRRV